VARDFAAHDLAGIDHRRTRVEAHPALTAGKPAHRDNHRIGRFRDDAVGGHFNAGVNGYVQLANLPFQPIHRQRQSFPPRRGCRQPDRAAELRIRVRTRSRDARARLRLAPLPARLGRRPRSEPDADPRRFQRGKFSLPLITGGGIIDATQARVLHQADDVVLIG
jgi:hypothetical protein